MNLNVEFSSKSGILFPVITNVSSHSVLLSMVCSLVAQHPRSVHIVFHSRNFIK